MLVLMFSCHHEHNPQYNIMSCFQQITLIKKYILFADLNLLTIESLVMYKLSQCLKDALPHCAPLIHTK